MEKGIKKYYLKGLQITLMLLLIADGYNALAQVVSKDSGGEIIIMWDNKQRITGGGGRIQDNEKRIAVNSVLKKGVALFSLAGGKKNIEADKYAGLFFNNIPGLAKGITFWRYKPWNSWTKPVAVTDATKMESWDIQFFYWQYNDGVYGAAIPLSGNGFRTTLGSNENKWGSKAIAYADNKHQSEIPAISIAFGKDPYELFARIYSVSLEYMGKGENLKVKKTLPEPFKYIGWCTWNSSEMGRELNEEHLVQGVKTFTDQHFPLGWVLIDDGWFQHKGSQLHSIIPSHEKFPSGFKPMIDRLKRDYGIRYMGVWHAFNGYWNGIDSASELGQHYKGQLFSWTQRERVDVDVSPLKTYYFIRPDSDSLPAFYDRWHSYLKLQGIDFIKVDNQLVVERMSRNNYPVFSLSEAMHKALYRSADKYFKGAVINCMDMTAEAYLNFGHSAVARAEEDYFPWEKNENYNLQKGNAAAHILQAIYNSIYFSQMVYPDFDMFESANPNAVMHALARTLNNGPVYITDKPGQQNFDLLRKIVFSDGVAIRSGAPLLPTEDCLFQVQMPTLFKAYSQVRNTGLLAVFNAADADEVEGKVKPSDIPGMKGDRFVLFDYFSNRSTLVKKQDYAHVILPRLGYGLFYVIPLTNGFAPIGLTNKYNAPATIISEKWISNNLVAITLYEGGFFKAYSQRKPSSIRVNGKDVPFSFENNLVDVRIDESDMRPSLSIQWK